MFKDIALKELLVVLYVIVLNMFDIVSERIQSPVYDIVINKLGGQISNSDISSIVLHMEKMGYILLFLILFGNYISKQITDSPVYIFSRINDRRIWYIKERMKLYGVAVIYIILYLSVIILMSCRLSNMKICSSDIKSIIIIGVYLLLQLTLLTNLCEALTIRLTEPIALVICIMLIILGTILATEWKGNIATFLNIFILFTGSAITARTNLIRLVYLLLLNASLHCCISVKIKKYEFV